MSTGYSPNDVKDAIEFAENKYGTHLKLMEVWTKRSPVGLRAMAAAEAEFMKSKVLNALEANALASAISATNQCYYCMHVHASIAMKNGLSVDDAKEILEGGLPKEKRLRALVKTAKLVIAKKGNLNVKDREDVKRWGVSDTELYEIAPMIGLLTLANFTNLLEMPPLDDEFKDATVTQ